LITVEKKLIKREKKMISLSRIYRIFVYIKWRII